MIRNALKRALVRGAGLRCSFCRKSDQEVAKLIGGPGVYVCDACVGICDRILAGQATLKFPSWELRSDAELLAALPSSEAAVESARAVLQAQIDALRSRDVSWTDIGAALKISRQAAWERFS
jgi:ATP-dependent Clp protease ATP-binding subunit ClpX